MVSDNLRGALMMSGSMVAFTLNDTCMKAMAGQVPLFQAVFLRGIGTVILLALVLRHLGRLRGGVSARDWRLIGFRTAMEVLAAYFFLTALFNMPIANATSILQALPLAVTLGAALFLGESVGWRRIAAITVGFVGVLLIVKPGTAGFNLYSLYALAAVICIVGRDLAARQMSRDVPSALVALAAAFGVTLAFGAASLTVAWAPLELREGALLLGAMTMVIFGYVLSVSAMRVGDVGTVAPFRYVSLLTALVVGYQVFGEWPDTLSLVGAAIIVAAGVFTLLRNQRTMPRQGGLRRR